MPKQLKILIKEDKKELDSLIRRSTSMLSKSRLKALLLIMNNKVKYYSEIGSKLGYTEKTVREWFKKYQSEGIVGYLSIKSGGNSRKVISKRAKGLIEEALNNEKATITSYVELLAILEEEYGITIKYQTLYRHCRKVHKSKLKLSRKSHYKQDKKAIEAFKKPQ